MEKDTFHQFEADRDEEEILGAEAGIQPPEGYDPDEGFEPAILSIELDQEDAPDVCRYCNGLGTVPNTDDRSFNVRMPCDRCHGTGVPHPITYLPFYVRYLIGRGIHDRNAETFPYVLGDSDLSAIPPADLAYAADELADTMPRAVTKGQKTEALARRRTYLRLAAIALRHFAGDPERLELIAVVIRAVARGRRPTR